MGKINMHDVAKRAGVSVATVSHVINNNHPVSEKTRQKVIDSISELNYHPDTVARSFKTGKTNLIGFIVPDIANAFYSVLVEEIENIISQNGYKLIIMNTQEEPEREIKNLQVIKSGYLDGLIIASTHEYYESVADILDNYLPVVFIDRKPVSCTKDVVTVNTYTPLYEAICRLIEKGHKQIGFASGIERLSSVRERHRAYIDAMKKYGIYDPSLYQEGELRQLDIYMDMNYFFEKECTAIVFANSQLATKGLWYIMETGNLPERGVEILGIQDGIDAQFGLDYMNLIIQPTRELAINAATRLMNKIKNNDTTVVETVLEAHYVPRKRLLSSLFQDSII